MRAGFHCAIMQRGIAGLQAADDKRKAAPPMRNRPFSLVVHPCTPDRLRDEDADQRFENWKLRRALARPYFLRSTARGSRVRKPAAFTGARSAGS